MSKTVLDMPFKGYPRPDGGIGVRNLVAIMYTVDCGRFVSEQISNSVKDGVAVGWFNCNNMANGEDFDTLLGIGRNPNVGAVLVVGLGCESNSPSKLADALSKTGKPVDHLVIQGRGGTKKTIERGKTIANKMRKEISAIRRKSQPISSLTVGVKCGGSDAYSALSANPAVGISADLVIDNGGRILSSELTELTGCERQILQRANSPEIGKRAVDLIVASVSEFEARFGKEHTMMSPGNVSGGLTTIEEKSLGALMKTGHRKLVGILRPGEYPTESGWYLVDGLVAKSIRHFGLEADGEPTDFAASGAQIVLFTTGRGSANGNVIAPTIKVCANPRTFRNMEDDMDFNAGTIIEGRETIEKAGQRLFNQLLEVASGTLTKSEILGHKEGGMILGGRPLSTQVTAFCE